jgi:hypothetical protein
MSRIGEFGISRKTGYKILTRYNEVGLEGLTDRQKCFTIGMGLLPSLVAGLRAVCAAFPDPRKGRRGSNSSIGLPSFQGIFALPQKARLCKPCLRNELSPLSQEGHNGLADPRAHFLIARVAKCFP